MRRDSVGKMKTIDEVIKAFEQCKDDKCYGCAYHEKVHANSCIAKRDSDALIFLNAYQWQMTNPDGDHLQLEKCRARLSDFYRNDPLSWEELRQMAGKPIWVEGSHGPALSYKGWALISFDRQGNDMKCQLYNSAEFWIGEEDYGTDWQAYRKERE